MLQPPMETPARLFEAWVQRWEEGWDSEIGEIVHAVEARSASSLASTERRLTAALTTDRDAFGRWGDAHARRWAEQGGEVRAVHEEVEALQAALALERGAHAQSLTEMRAVREDVKNVQAALEQSARGESLHQLREEMRQEAAAATDEVERKNAATVAAAIEAQAKKTQGTLDALARGLNEFGPSLIAQHEEGFADLRQELLARQAVADTTMQALAVAIRERQAETGAVDEKTKQMLHLANHTIGALDATKADTQALTERLAVLEVAQSDVSSTTVDEAMAALNQEIAEISASLGVAISALSSEGEEYCGFARDHPRRRSLWAEGGARRAAEQAARSAHGPIIALRASHAADASARGGHHRQGRRGHFGRQRFD